MNVHLYMMGPLSGHDCGAQPNRGFVLASLLTRPQPKVGWTNVKPRRQNVSHWPTDFGDISGIARDHRGAQRQSHLLCFAPTSGRRHHRQQYYNHIELDLWTGTTPLKAEGPLTWATSAVEQTRWWETVKKKYSIFIKIKRIRWILWMWTIHSHETGFIPSTISLRHVYICKSREEHASVVHDVAIRRGHAIWLLHQKKGVMIGWTRGVQSSEFEGPSLLLLL